MANKYWAAGVSGNWNDILSWSDFAIGTPAGALVPGAGDAAIFNAASGTVTATLDISPDIQRLTCTGFTGTLAFGTNTISVNDLGTIFAGSTTMTVTGTPQIICTYTGASGRTITPAAVTEANSISFRITAGTGTLSIGTGAVRNLDFTDGTNPTGYAGAAQNMVPTIYGNFKASTGMTKVAGTGTFTFAATSGTKTITTAAVVFDNPFTFNGVGGTWQLQDALTSGATRTMTLTNGTLDLNGYTITTGIFSSSNSNTRTLAFGTGKIVLTSTSGIIFTTGTFTNLTVSGTSLVQCTNGGAGTRTINLGTGAISEANAINFDITAGSDIVSLFGGGGAAKNINFTGFSGTIDLPSTKVFFGNWNSGSAIAFSGVTTVTFAATSSTKTIRSGGLTWLGNVTFNGVGGVWSGQDALSVTSALTMTNGTLQLKASVTSTVGSFVTSGTNTKFLQSTLAGTQATLSQVSGTVDASYLTIQDINATGGATWNAFTTSGNVDAGDNTGWNFGGTPDVDTEVGYRLRSFTQPRRF